MTGPEDRINPQPTWPVVPNAFATAEDAFNAGNYPLALHLAANDQAMRGAAMVMCGAIAPGLALLEPFDDPRSRLIRAYAHWCLNANADARLLLESLDDTPLAGIATAMRGFLDEPVDIVLLAMPGPDRVERFAKASGFTIHAIQLDPENFGMTMIEVLGTLPTGTRPRLLLSLDAFGPYLPRQPKAPGIPLVFWTGDHDFFFATRSADFSRADLIVVNSAAEQIEIARHYPGRVTALPAHESHLDAANFTEVVENRDTDLLFSGRAFTPYMRDKAQFLFRYATVDDPTAKIELVDGYLPVGIYARRLANARVVPLWWRYAGGVQTRAIEALFSGSAVLAPEQGVAAPLLGKAAPGYRSAVDVAPATLLADRRQSDRSALNAVFWETPRREERFLKFCLLQSLLTRPRTDAADEPVAVPVELRGYDPARGAKVYIAIAKMNAASNNPSAATFTHAAASAFYAALLLPDNTTVARRALDFYRAGRTAFPESLTLRFNSARAQWTCGQRQDALNEFQGIVDTFPDLHFDPRRDALLSHRVRALAEMFPYGDFYRAVVDADERAREPREMIASSALAYIGADLIERDQAGLAVALLRRATERCSVNVAAWRLLTRALAASKAAPADIRAAFYRAVNLYPAELFELLPIGLAAEMAEQRRGAAADILRQWVLVRTRTRDVAGKPLAVSAAAITAADTHRGLLADWTRPLLDRMVAEERGDSD